MLFGLAHRRAARVAGYGCTWATLAGLLFGGIFVLTGSLLGPIAAHAIVNGYNLVFLRNHDPSPKSRRLGRSLGPLGRVSRAPHQAVAVANGALTPMNASSEHRDPVNCRHAERCSRCPLIALPYEEQLAHKTGSRSGRLRDLPRARRAAGRCGSPCRNAHRLSRPGQADGLDRPEWRSGRWGCYARTTGQGADPHQVVDIPDAACSAGFATRHCRPSCAPRGSSCGNRGVPRPRGIGWVPHSC